MSRRLLLPVGLALCASSIARADLPAGTGTAAFEVRIPDPNGDQGNPTSWVPPGTTQAQGYYFNLAGCACARDFAIRVTITGASRPTPLANKKVELWAGDNCNDLTTRTNSCVEITPQAPISDYDTLLTTTDHVMPMRPVVDLKSSDACSRTQGSSTVWFLVDSNGTGSTLDSMGSVPVPFDKLPPPMPTDIKASGGENAIQLDWTLPNASTSEIAYFQALCQTTAGVARAKGPEGLTPRYDTPFLECGANATDIDITQVHTDPSLNPPPDANVPDAQPAFDAAVASAGGSINAVPPGDGTFDGLDESFLCGETAGTDNGMRIKDLDNNTAYNVILLAIDKSGNATGVKFIESIQPQPVTDDWEDLHDQGSQIESGFCLISDTYGGGGPITNAMRAFRDDTLGATGFGRAFTRFYYAHVAWLGAYVRAYWPLRIVAAIVLAPLVMLALAWHVLTLPGLLALGLAFWLWRRRRARARTVARLAMASAIVLAVLAGTGTAHAQSDDDWTYIGEDDAPVGVHDPVWIVGIKLGPYIPQIDAQFQAQTGKTTRPYHQMFGGYNLMPTIEVDRVVWHGIGQLTVGGSIGLLAKSAKAFDALSMPTDPDRTRSEGDSNSFRMVPMAATVAYRFSYLDDQWGIPIIPYARGGLAYYAWWINAPNGNLAFVGDGNCHPDTATMTCPKQTAIGASMGLVGSIGIAIRGERIDPDAAASMRDGGIDHAGFYAELSTAWVDSFGNAHRFSLGDTTFFGGVTFEF